MHFASVAVILLSAFVTPLVSASTSWDALREYVCAQQCPGGVRDVAIVGGGVSGLYSAWRLKSTLPDSKIAVLEATHRLGGRLWSVPIPGKPWSEKKLVSADFLSSLW